MKSKLNQWRLLSTALSVAASTLLPGCTEPNFKPDSPSVAASSAPADAVVNPGNADAAFNAFNNAFLVNSGGQTYYKSSVNDGTPEHTFLAALDILLAEDVYERTGRAEHKNLINNLCNTFLQKLPTPWGYNGWNDDLGWYSMAMVRGYQMTGTPKFLAAARNGFDEAFTRGWDTRWNGGGIWEQQIEMVPSGQKINKEALSNNTRTYAKCISRSVSQWKSAVLRSVVLVEHCETLRQHPVTLREIHAA